MSRVILLACTALVAFAMPADAAPVLTAFIATAAGGALTGALAGGVVWSAVLGQAAVAGVLAGAQALLEPKAKSAPAAEAQNITLNRITPLTNGLILYGERTLGGSIVARSTTPSGGKANALYHSVIPLVCHEIDGAVAIHIGETLVWTEEQYQIDAAAAVLPEHHWGQIASAFQHKVALRIYKGTPEQEAEPLYVQAAAEWKETARGRGIAYLYFNAAFDRNLFPQGVMQIRVRLRGKKVFDPRTGLTAYSENAALHVRDYALTPEIFGGIGWSAQDVDDASIIALANVADEDVGGEARFAFNGVLDTALGCDENLDRLSTSWGGWWTVDRGRLSVGGGWYDPPTFTVTEDMMRGPIRVRARRPFEEQFNIVKAVYADPDAEHTPTDLPVLSSTVYRAQDNGEDLVRDLGELPGEVSHARGQGLMKLALLKGRRQRLADIPCSPEVWGVRLGGNVRVDVPRRGWDQKPFEVVGRTARISANEVRVALSCIETGPDVFDRDTSTETPKPAGSVSSFPNPTALPVVFAPSASEELYETRGGGGLKTRVLVTSDTENPFIETWQFRYQMGADPVVIGPMTQEAQHVFDDMRPGSYVFGARAVTRRGIVGDWAIGNPVQVLGVNDTPTAVTGLVVQAAGGAVAMMRWDRHPSLDVRQGGRIEFRHAPLLTGATWQSSTGIGKAVSGDLTVASLPLKAGTYLARAFDATGIPGPVSMATTKAANLASLVTVSTITEDPAFAGQKTDCTIDAANLVIDQGALSATYELASIIDLGSVQSVRLVTELSVIIGRRDDLFWQRGGTPFWQRGGDLFWQSSAAFGDVDVQVSETDDDPAGSPVWSPYQSLDAADFSARAFRFRAVLSVENIDFETRISALSVTALQGA